MNARRDQARRVARRGARHRSGTRHDQRSAERSPLGGAEEIERTGDSARRLPPSGEDRGQADEIAQLTGVLNRMLASLERSRASERRFLADASHELRTPVTTLLGNVEYAARHGADEEVLEDLRRDAARLASLVDGLLALERVGAAAAPEPAPVALDRVVADSVRARERA